MQTEILLGCCENSLRQHYFTLFSDGDDGFVKVLYLECFYLPSINGREGCGDVKINWP